MSENPAASDWVAGRGEKWSAHLSGIEATLTPVDEPLIRALHLDAPWRIADIGCGGGGTALEILRLAPAGSVVHGFDISPAQIESARRRIPTGEPALAFEIADVATAAAPGEPYDRLVSRFGIMFFSDPSAAFANLLHWLAPGGLFAFAVWGDPSENPWFTTVREVVAKVAEMPPSEPDGPGPFRYGEADKLLVLLEHAGFGELDVHDWRGRLAIGGGLPPAEAADFALESFSSIADLLAKAGDKALNEARKSLTALFSQHQQNNGVTMNACAHIVTGTRLS
jgi:SAM-dependent methyltransferase